MDAGIMHTITGNHQLFGYAGIILRVDLTKSEITSDQLEEDVLRKFVGGATLGIKYIYDEVPTGIEFSDPANRFFLGTGPLGGTRVSGSGGIAIVTKGALTNGIASTQANGFFGTYLRFNGYDAIILSGAAPKLSYLYIHDGIAELRDASKLEGKRTHETVGLIREELHKGERELSVLCIGPSGENLVRFAGVIIDEGHAAAHNGVGAVMGSKRLKAIAVERYKNSIPLKDSQGVSEFAKKLLENTLSGMYGRTILSEGTCGPNVGPGNKTGGIPVKNYTTSIHVIDDDKLQTYSPKSLRERFGATPHPCWACSAKHCHMMKIPDGKYINRVIEEPEGEGVSEFSSNVGINDVTTTMVLNDEVDALGFDMNESGWVISWVIECFEKRILTKKETDGLEMTWGNGEAIMIMLNKIARREGFGNILAEGVMRAAKQVGGQAQNMAVHTMKGNTPRGHDHRYMWFEMFDTCVSNMGTLETKGIAPYKLLGLPEIWDRFDPQAVSTVEAKIKGVMLFEDSMYVCHFNTAGALDLILGAVNAATGWNMDFEEAMAVGKRAVNLARAFNLKNGIGAELDAPSVRYGSTPIDGVRAGCGIAPHWDKMLRNYYGLMGWDEKTSKPLPETLRALGLDYVIPQLWP
jgi:aldehyde:ferredoxin oxidoreductase